MNANFYSIFIVIKSSANVIILFNETCVDYLDVTQITFEVVCRAFNFARFHPGLGIKVNRFYDC